MHVDAPPAAVWALVSDPTRTGELSPENTGARWTGGATGPVVGAEFTGTNQHGPVRWSTRCTVVAADPEEHFAFQVRESAMRWGYRLRAVDGGTELRQYRVQLGPKPWVARLASASGVLGRDREERMREGMRRTLSAVKRTLES